MKVIRTASVKLDVSPQESQILLQTLEAYTKAYNFCCSTDFQNNTKNGIVLHKLTHKATSSKCGHIKRSNRKSQSDFRCGKCSFRLNADLNAARNIVLKHLDSKAFNESRESDRAEVNQPIVQLANGEQGTSPCL